MKIAITLLAAAVAAAVVPQQALAADLLYTLTPTTGSGYTASWQVPMNPLPFQSVAGEGFAMQRVAGTFPRATEGFAYIDFYAADNDGGLMISDDDSRRILATLYGVQLYTGTEAAPVMRKGVFTLTTGQNGGRVYSLTVTDAPGVVPEPAGWLTIIGGAGLIGAGLRRRRRVTVRFA